MKVLHLASHLDTGGITTYIQALIQPLKSQGVEILVVSGGGESALKLQAAGAKVFTLPIRTKSELNPKIYSAIPELLRIIKDEKVEILHAHSRVTQVMAYWASRFSKIPFVTTCHGFYKVRWGRRLLPAWGSGVIAISDGVADHLRKDFNLPETRVHMIYNGVDLKDLNLRLSQAKPAAVRHKFGFQEKDIVLGNIARLVEEKGQEYLIRSIPSILKKYPSVKVLIVGDGRTRLKLEKLTFELGVNAQVHFTGYLQNVAEALSAMDIFVFPATWREGFGLSLVEAMGAGKPLVVSNTCTLSFLIEREKAGLLVPPYDAGAISEAVDALLSDNMRRQVLVKNGMRIANDYFSLEAMAVKIAALYREILTKTRG